MQKQDYNSKLFIDKVKDKLYTFVSGQMKEIKRNLNKTSADSS